MLADLGHAASAKMGSKEESQTAAVLDLVTRLHSGIIYVSALCLRRMNECYDASVPTRCLLPTAFIPAQSVLFTLSLSPKLTE